MTASSDLQQPSTIVLNDHGIWGSCACGGKIVYFADSGVRCKKCKKLYGTWVESLRKAKQEEHRRKEHIARLIELKKFDDDMQI